MLLNANTAISTSTVLLVPYSKWHVPKYHEWMKDEGIQQATASEPLTLEEEYVMQQSWRTDADKLTFIICLPQSRVDDDDGNDDQLETTTTTTTTTTMTIEDDDTPERMLGDVNLFLRFDDNDDDDDGESSDHKSSSPRKIIGEIELMIAEKHNQRKGFGRASLLTFLRYIIEHESDILREFLCVNESGQQLQGDEALQLYCVSVKIGQVNTRSLGLFESLGFRKLSSEPNYFGEFELRRSREDLQRMKMKDDDGYRELSYRGESYR